MKTRNFLVVAGGLGLLWYLWYTNKSKKPVTVADLGNKNPIGGGGAPTVIPAVDVLLKNPVTVADLSNKNANNNGSVTARVRNARRVIPAERPPLKEPLYGQPTNLLPNAYNDNIGLPIQRDRGTFVYNDFQNFSGSTTDIQKACRCNSKNKKRYSLDIPKLP